MKYLVAVCVSLIAALSSAATVEHPRGCIYILGTCSEECPVGTHSYVIGCGYRTPEPSCREPNPIPEEDMLCDYSDCYCDPPTIRDENTNKCVLKEECTPQKAIPDFLFGLPTPTLQPPVEEPKAEEPKTEEPKAEEPKPAKLN